MLRSSASAAAKKRVHVSCKAPMVEVKKKCCAVFGLEPCSVQMWDYYHDSYYVNLEDLVRNKDDFSDSKLLEDNDIMLLEKDQDGTFPEAKRARHRAAAD